MTPRKHRHADVPGYTVPLYTSDHYTQCKGTNCTATAVNPKHSDECIKEHEAAYSGEYASDVRSLHKWEIITDRELLELAAKAAGESQLVPYKQEWLDSEESVAWNPLTSDADALRLAVKLDLLILPYPDDNAVRVTRLDQPDTVVSWGSPPDPYSATRSAIVVAAAAIGETP